MAEPTIRQKACPHTSFRSRCNVSYLDDTQRWYVDVTLECSQCDLPFHFIAPDYGLLLDRPALSPDATELRCPIAPGAAALPPSGTQMRFEMPSVERPKES